MRKLVFLSIFLFLLITPQAHAASSYVLPYPGIMPGNKLFIVSEIGDELKGMFSFGDFSRFKYNLSQSDKYLVQSKTLFEYGQYPKAVEALRKSNSYFKLLNLNLRSAQNNNKDITEKTAIFNNASLKHVEVLEKLDEDLPSTYVWQDEKEAPYTINLDSEIKKGIKSRIQK